ncbi:MAG: HD domain-containing protein [bacterium]
MSPALLPPIPPALRALEAVYIGPAARLAVGGAPIHVRPELAIPRDAATLRDAHPALAPDPHRRGSLLADRWRVWPAPDGIEAFLTARAIPADAFAVRPDGGLVDPLDGFADFRAGQLRVPDAAWGRRDALPVEIPALVGELAARVDDGLVERLAEHAHHVFRADRHELRAALTRLLVSRRAAGMLALLARSGVLAYVLPEAAALVDFHRSSRHHHKDVWNHTRVVVRQAVPRPVIRWAALMHDIGKAHTRGYAPGGKVHFLRHDELGAMMFEGIAHRLDFPPALGERIRLLVLHHLRAGMYLPEWTDAAVRRFAADMGPVLDDLLLLSRADVTSRRPGKRRAAMFSLKALRDRIDAVRAADAAARPQVPKGLGTEIIRALGVPPGPRVGELRRCCEEAVRDGRLPPSPDLDACLRFLRAIVERDAA